ncbi:hypothetical protein SDC9_121816 [bioreactor metagenome]|uniref:Uncharacterized protein n=1 Tax=bioreactor metagenome TaxID=1076179 RepID=A0A645CD04_9ZZZZ
MTVVHHLFSRQVGAESGQRRVGQNGVDMNRPSLRRKALRGGDIRAGQHFLLMKHCLSHTAAADQRQRTGI